LHQAGHYRAVDVKKEITTRCACQVPLLNDFSSSQATSSSSNTCLLASTKHASLSQGVAFIVGNPWSPARSGEQHPQQQTGTDTPS
ncbi:hypothetical protein JRQ81_002783, partial [Phrynocephalus forsythii]